MSVKNIETTVTTSRKFGDDYCDYDCEHVETYTKFPPVAVCKLSGAMIQQDDKGRLERTVYCKYLCGEEVEERFWSPMK